MMVDKKEPGGDYEVGCGKPPKEYQFRPGQSGNLKGRPPKQKPKRIDAAAVLNEPLAVKNSGGRRKMPPFEVSVRRLVERGLKRKDLNAILEFLKLCESYQLLVPPPANQGGGVIIAPKGVDFDEWLESVTELVPASSPDSDDGDFD